MGMSQFTSAWLAAHEARTMKTPKQSAMVDGCRRESELHEQIFAECRRRGWIALHGAMSERTHRTAGEPDFILMGQRDLAKDPTYAGKVESPWMVPAVYFIECKTRIGKLSTDQAAMAAHAAKLGHTIHVVRSFEEFLKII
jgi:hypothetical protein